MPIAPAVPVAVAPPDRGPMGEVAAAPLRLRHDGTATTVLA
ncbi:hypothetical protein [Nocardia brasiliensis]|nr:hypothetical protein [Nocardia brasiliensis]